MTTTVTQPSNGISQPSEQLADQIAGALTGSGVEVEVIPEPLLRSPAFRVALTVRVIIALAMTGAVVWDAVKGGDWLEVLGLSVTAASFWVVTMAAFRGVSVSNPR